MHTDHNGQRHYEAAEDLLPPGPWHAKGNKLMAGGQTVAVMMCHRPVAVAGAVAEIVNRARSSDSATIEKLLKRIQSLEAENETLENRLDEARAALD